MKYTAVFLMLSAYILLEVLDILFRHDIMDSIKYQQIKNQ